jgi:3-methyladenine DNA glycosylase Mpg
MRRVATMTRTMARPHSFTHREHTMRNLTTDEQDFITEILIRSMKNAKGGVYGTRSPWAEERLDATRVDYTVDGNFVTALLVTPMRDGAADFLRIRTGVAKRNPTDDLDFARGERIALARAVRQFPSEFWLDEAPSRNSDSAAKPAKRKYAATKRTGRPTVDTVLNAMRD